MKQWWYLALVAVMALASGRAAAQPAPGKRVVAAPVTITHAQCDGPLGKFDIFVGEAHDAQNRLTGKYEIVLRCTQKSTNPGEKLGVAVFDGRGTQVLRRQGMTPANGQEVVRLGPFPPAQMLALTEMHITLYRANGVPLPGDNVRGMRCGLPVVPPLRSALPGAGGNGGVAPLPGSPPAHSAPPSNVGRPRL